jgi:hypothetical protein
MIIEQPRFKIYICDHEIHVDTFLICCIKPIYSIVILTL